MSPYPCSLARRRAYAEYMTQGPGAINRVGHLPAYVIPPLEYPLGVLVQRMLGNQVLNQGMKTRSSTIKIIVSTKGHTPRNIV